MTPTQLRAKLADERVNLSALERLSGVPIRTLRRIRKGHTEAMPSTVERVAPHIKEARK